MYSLVVKNDRVDWRRGGLMAFQFLCEQCGKRMAVPDRTQGKQAKCPFCAALMTIPSPDPVTPTAQPLVEAGPVLPFHPAVSPPKPVPAVTLANPAMMIVCAWLLCFYGILGLAVLGLEVIVFSSETGQAMMQQVTDQMVTPPGVNKEEIKVAVVVFMKALVGIGAVAGIIVLIGGIQMARRRTWWLSLLAAICAFFPYHPFLIVIGWPVAIWAIVMIVRNRGLFVQPIKS